MDNLIVKVEDGSIADQLEIKAGDILLKINDKDIKDVFDYRYLIKDEYLEVLILQDGEEWLFEIEKDEDEDLGIVFGSGLMDNAHSCTNKCIFCFIDQLPKNMRDTLYFKDDDTRLSFLQGNYVTLTNMTVQDIDRIIYYRLSPINISVHAFDEKLRLFMLKNPNSSNLKQYIEKLYDANIAMNFQVVLCKDINDKENLDFTIKSLSNYLPVAKSLSIVPVGITKYREELYKLNPFDCASSKDVINLVEGWQKKLKETKGTSFVFVSDEFYLKANIPLPSYKSYEDFPQIENGVGMISLFEYEFKKAFNNLKNIEYKEISILTGVLAYDFMCSISKAIADKFKVRINVYKIENEFFGSEITVSGLITGTDIINQLREKSLGEIVLIPKNALRFEDTVFLDDVLISDLEVKLGTKTIAVSTTAESLISAITKL